MYSMAALVATNYVRFRAMQISFMVPLCSSWSNAIVHELFCVRVEVIFSAGDVIPARSEYRLLRFLVSSPSVQAPQRVVNTVRVIVALCSSLSVASTGRIWTTSGQRRLVQVLEQARRERLLVRMPLNH